MLIDWYTVGAQALNFVILVWLMKRYLYKPILHAIDAREKRIAAELADAAAKEATATKEKDEFQRKSEELDQQRATLLKKATDDANVERQRLFAEARQAADALSAKRQEALTTDAKNLNRAIQQRTQREVFSIARKALMDLATTSLEERLTAVFTHRLQELDGSTKAGLVKALEAASGSALVRSAFELPPDQRAVVQNALNETFSADVHVRFESAPDLVSGIELTASGQKMGWSIDGYLASLQSGIDDLLKEKAQEKAKDDKAKDDKAKDDKAKDDKAKDDKAKDDKAKDDKAKDGKAEDDKVKDDKAKDDKAEDDKAKDDKPEDDKAKDDKANDDKSKDDKAEDGKAKDDKPEDGKVKDDKSKDDKPEDDKAKDDKPEDDKSKDDKSNDGKAKDDKPEGTATPTRGAPEAEVKSQ
jgi:F-type H+-transporting ATPase subunit b